MNNFAVDMKKIELAFVLCLAVSAAANSRNLSDAVPAVPSEGLLTATPVVVARERFSVSDFMLAYPLPDKAWRRTDNPDRPFIYHPRPVGDTLHFSVADSLRLYQMTCGSKRYFAACDSTGYGGYDIYVQQRDPVKGVWSEPENMGFPYSSAADDFLFVDTADGRFSMFASNRGCSQDSVWVYVVEYNPAQVRSYVSDPLKLLRIAELNPSDSRAAAMDPNAVLYLEKMEALKAARKDLDAVEKELSYLRGEYIFAEGLSREQMKAKIMEMEAGIGAKRTAYMKAMKDMQDLELRFEREGVNIDLSGLLNEVQEKGFEFTQRTFGLDVNVKFDK